MNRQSTTEKSISLVIARAALAKLYLCAAALFSTVTFGQGVGKVYTPYVEPLETEIEWFGFFYDTEEGNIQQHRLGLGRSLGERWFAEIYLVGSDAQSGGMDINAYELEAIWQLTEQGEYNYDWGVLFEYEDSLDYSSHEFATALLVAKDLQRWTATANLFAIYEWGQDTVNEFEGALSSQLRYRYRETFEPGVEIHVADGVQAIGPVISGVYRPGIGRRLRWEVGFFVDLASVESERTLKAGLEYEF